MDPVTCSTCLTLNPPAAPACVRCNSPLSGSPPGGSPPSDPPGSRPAPVALPEPEPPPAPARDRPPRRDERLRSLSWADQRRIVRRVEIAGAVVVLLLLAVGAVFVWRHAPRRVDGAAVAGEISGQLSQRLGQPVTVTCPPRPARSAGTTFSCTATDPAGGRRTVDVTVTGDDGSYKWTLR